MCLLLTFQMHPSLRRRMLALLTKRTKQSPSLNAMKSEVQRYSVCVARHGETIFECDEERSATGYLFAIIPAHLPFECDEERSATPIYEASLCLLQSLNAMKSGVFLNEGN